MTNNIEVFTQNSIRITTKSGKKIYIDPLHIKEESHDADYIFITHDHYDHFSLEDINKVLQMETIFVVPEKLDYKLRKNTYAGRNFVVAPSMHYENEDFTFDTVPAYNIMKPFHPKSSGWVGYNLNIDGVAIYVAGDTDATNEAKSVKCDVALVPIGGTYTMDATAAAKLVNEIKPKVAIPVHYGSIVGKPSDGDSFASLVNDEIKVEFKIQF